MSADPLDQLAGAVFRAFNPDPLDQLAEAVSAAFAEAADSAAQAGHLDRADLLSRHRAFQARQAAKYGPPEALFDRLQARGRGGLSGQVWC